MRRRGVWEGITVVLLVHGLAGCGFLNQFRKSNSNVNNSQQHPGGPRGEPVPEGAILEFAVQPTGAIEGLEFFRYPKVRVVNETGEVRDDIALHCEITGVDGITLTGTLAASGAGVVEFDDLSASGGTGEYGLEVTCADFGTMESNPFMIYSPADGGDGNTSGTPYLISNVYQLQAIAFDIPTSGAYYQLTGDIDATETSTWHGGEGFRPIGDPWENYLDGDFHTIRGLFINRPLEDSVGLFRDITNTGSANRLGLSDVKITGNNYVGGIAGQTAASSTINEIFVSGSISGSNYIGGLIGCDFGGGTISQLLVDVAVAGTTQIGGMFGCINSSLTITGAGGKVRISSAGGQAGGAIGYLSTIASISHSAISGHLVSAGPYAGGFIGEDASGGTSLAAIQAHVNVRSTVASGSSAYAGGFAGALTSELSGILATGSVSANGMKVGGLAGSTNANIESSGSHGNIIGGGYVGGLVGHQTTGVISYSFAVGDMQGPSTSSGGLVGFSVGTTAGSFYRDPAIGIAGCQGSNSTSAMGAADCVTSTTGTAADQADGGFGGDLVEGMKISAADADSFPIEGWCQLALHGSTVAISVNDGSTTVNGSTTCSNGKWRKTLDLTDLSDGSLHIAVNISIGSSSTAVTLSKDVAACRSKSLTDEFAEGNGSAVDPFLICSSDQYRNMVARFSENNAYTFALGNNIDLSDRLTVPAVSTGTCTSETMMCDTIQGDHFTIRSPRIVRTGNDASLFGAIGDPGTVNNLFVIDAVVVGDIATGIIAGTVDSFTAMTNLYTHGIVIGSSNYAGGVFGRVTTGSTNTNLDSTAHVTGLSWVGGITGSLESGGITQSIAEGHISTSAGTAGGFVGEIMNAGVQILEGKATGHVVGTTGSSDQGGFAGKNNGAEISDSYAWGQVTSGGTRIGGFIGYVTGGVTSNNIYASNNVISTGSVVGGLAGQVEGIGTNIGDSFMASDVVKAPTNAARVISSVDANAALNGLATMPYVANMLPNDLANGTDISISVTEVSGFATFLDDGDAANPESNWVNSKWSALDDGTDAKLPFLVFEE